MSMDRDLDYPSTAIALTHPARLAAQAIARGLTSRFEREFHYLELACGDASNLIALAARFPEATFVGVELDASAIDRGRQLAARLELSNLNLITGDLAQVELAGAFDYVVAHGVYSWVDHDVQRALLKRSAAWLKPAGVCYVSYNTLPGWGVRGLLRDVMRSAAHGATTPRSRLRNARVAVGRLQQHVQDSNPYGALLAAELDLALNKQPGYLLGEYLAEQNEPLFVTAFVKRAAAAGLVYLAEQIPATPDGALEQRVPAELERAGLDPAEAQRYLDVLCYRQFRATLLCRADQDTLRPRNIARLRDAGYLAGQLEVDAAEPLLGPGEPLKFRAATGAVIEADRPLQKAALLVLSRAWPHGLQSSELMSAAISELRQRGLLEVAAVFPEQIEQTILDLLELVDRRQLELLPWTPELTAQLGDRPTLQPLVRHEAERGVVTSLRHEPLQVDSLRAQIFELLDGQHTHEMLVRELHALRSAGELEVDEGYATAFDSLEQLSALVVAVVRQAFEQGLFEA